MDAHFLSDMRTNIMKYLWFLWISMKQFPWWKKVSIIVFYSFHAHVCEWHFRLVIIVISVLFSSTTTFQYYEKQLRAFVDSERKKTQNVPNYIFRVNKSKYNIKFISNRQKKKRRRSDGNSFSVNANGTSVWWWGGRRHHHHHHHNRQQEHECDEDRRESRI